MGRGSWGVRALVAIAIIACGVSFTPLVEGLAWLTRPSVLVLVASLGMAVTASLMRRRGWPVLVGAVVSLFALTGMFASSSALLFVIPGPGTPGAFASLAASGAQSIATQTIPAQPVEGIVFLLALGLMGLVLGIEALVFVARIPALVGVPLIAVSVIPNLIDPGTVQVPIFIVLAALYIAILLVLRRGNRPIVIVAGAVAVLGALALASVLPPVTADTAVRAGSGSNVNDPLIDVTKNLVQPNPHVAYTYQANQANYFTLSTVDEFSGLQWKSDSYQFGGTVAAISRDPGRPSDARTTEVDAEVSITGIAGSLLPVPWAPERVTGLTGDWTWERTTLGIRSTDADIKGQQYSVHAAVAAPTEDELEAAGTEVPADVKQFATTPDGMPSVIASTARDVTMGATNFYEEAVALQNFFHGYDFYYSTTAPVAGGYDGSGADVVAEFLVKKYGYCVHYSSAMALMARSLGIPARVAIGFTGGTATRNADNTTTYTVRTTDMHAWPELYFSGVGWVRFEPTPGIGSVPYFPKEAATSTGSPTDSAVPTDAASSATPTTTPSPGSDTNTNDGGEEQGSSAGTGLSTGALRAIIWSVLIALLVIILVAGPGATRAIRRRRRYVAVGEGDAFAAWNEVRDTAIDVGLSVSATRTPREFAAELADRMPPDAEDALGRLRAAVEARAYARGRAVPVEPADVQAVRRAMLRSASVGVRIRALLLSRSLFPQRSIG